MLDPKLIAGVEDEDPTIQNSGVRRRPETSIGGSV